MQDYDGVLPEAPAERLGIAARHAEHEQAGLAPRRIRRAALAGEIAMAGPGDLLEKRRVRRGVLRVAARAAARVRGADEGGLRDAVRAEERVKARVSLPDPQHELAALYEGSVLGGAIGVEETPVEGHAETLPRETSVLFAQFFGGPELFAAAGDLAAVDALGRCMHALADAAERAGARVVKRSADRLMALAASPDKAAEAATALHHAMEAAAVATGARLALGVGFHHGPVLQKDADVFGDTVNLAARIAELAGKGQVLTDLRTARAMGTEYRPWVRLLYTTDVKGRSEKVSLCEIVWRTDPDATASSLARPRPPAHEPAAALKLAYRGRTVVRRRTGEALTLGRDAQCDLVLASGQVSRRHCTIERKHDRFVLIDHSTNGTYVAAEGGPEVLVLREEITLPRRGALTLGEPRAGAADTVEFSCE